MSKKATTLYLDEGTVKEAKRLGFNLSRSCEIALERRILAEKRRLSFDYSENSKEVKPKINPTVIAGVAKSGQRRSVEGAVP